MEGRGAAHAVGGEPSLSPLQPTVKMEMSWVAGAMDEFMGEAIGSPGWVHEVSPESCKANRHPVWWSSQTGVASIPPALTTTLKPCMCRVDQSPRYVMSKTGALLHPQNDFTRSTCINAKPGRNSSCQGVVDRKRKVFESNKKTTARSKQQVLDMLTSLLAGSRLLSSIPTSCRIPLAVVDPPTCWVPLAERLCGRACVCSGSCKPWTRSSTHFAMRRSWTPRP